MKKKKNNSRAKQKPKRKPFEQLTLADDFMFCEVMRNKDLFKEFLQALLERPIGEIVYITKQLALSPSYDAKGIRLDVVARTKDETTYDAEMQNRNCPLMVRAQYYHMGIGINTLDRGDDDFNNVKNSYVIFICTFDRWKKGFALYRDAEGLEGLPDVKERNRARTIYLNCNYTIPNAPKPILLFLDYIKTKKFDESWMTCKLMTMLREAETRFKASPEERRAYMNYSCKMLDCKLDAIEENTANNIRSLMRTHGFTLDEALSALEVKEEYRENVLQLLQEEDED